MGWNVHLVHERQEFLRLTHGGIGFTDGMKQLGVPQKPLPFPWNLLGTKPIQQINLDRSKLSDHEIYKLQLLFPEANHNIFGSRKATTEKSTGLSPEVAELLRGF